MEKQLICLAGQNFGCHKTHRCTGRANNTELAINASFRLCGEF